MQKNVSSCMRDNGRRSEESTESPRSNVPTHKFPFFARRRLETLESLNTETSPDQSRHFPLDSRYQDFPGANATSVFSIWRSRACLESSTVHRDSSDGRDDGFSGSRRTPRSYVAAQTADPSCRREDTNIFLANDS